MSTCRTLRAAIAGAALFAFVASSTASAQVAKALLRQGDPMPAAGAGHVVEYLNNTAVNGVDGYVIGISTTDGVTDLSHYWGNATGGAPLLLRTEALIGNLQQYSFESFFGMDDQGVIAYSPMCDDTLSGATSLDTVFTDATPQAVEGQPIPSLPGKVWRFASRPGISMNGLAYWVGGIDDAASGASEGSGLFTSNGVVFKTGDLIPGLPAICGVNACDFDVRCSPSGNHWITGTDTDAPTANDYFVIRDGLPLYTSAGRVGENEPVPPENGGLAGELWSFFDFYGVDDAGNHLITGDTNAATAVDEFVAYNGVIVYREGEYLDGYQLSGSIEAAYMNSNKDIAFIWDVNDPVSAANVEALCLNARLLLKEGDKVDFTGDGVVDPYATLIDFTGISALTIDPDRRIYFVADVDIYGTPTSTTDDVECYMTITDPCGSIKRHGYGCAGTGGSVPSLDVTGCPLVGSSVTISITKGLGGSLSLLLLGWTMDWVPLGENCYLNIGSIIPSPIFLPLGGAGAGNGALSFSAVIPPLPVVPLAIDMQVFIADPATGFGYVATNGIELTMN
ncbi:MAG: hypothetical protein HY812_05100 [Planctomycetes bacterium]|nr:hypothetical protein [Planctomycetota bacterium]